MIYDDGLYVSLNYSLPLEYRGNEPKEYYKASVSFQTTELNKLFTLTFKLLNEETLVSTTDEEGIKENSWM